MDENPRPQWRPEPEPGNTLERLLQKAATDPAQHGSMMRALWDTELHTVIEYHPEVVGTTMELRNGSRMPPFVLVTDDTGVFIPVFSSEAVAEYCIAKHSKEKRPQAIASMPGEAFFIMMSQLKHDVILNPGMTHRLVLKPEAIAALVSGDLRHSRPSHGNEEATHLFGIEPESTPPAFRDAIRRFCDRTPVPIAVYLFVQGDPDTGKPVMNQWRLILRLRGEDNDFYNDFGLLAEKLLPAGNELRIGVVTDDGPSLAFLQKHQPLWPVIPD